MTRMSIEPHGPAQRYDTIRIENDRERSAAEARQFAVRLHPDVDRIVITGRNGYFLYEEYVLRGDGVWIDKHPPREGEGSSMHRVISYIVRRLFP